MRISFASATLPTSPVGPALTTDSACGCARASVPFVAARQAINVRIRMRRGPVMGMDFTCGCSSGRPLSVDGASHHTVAQHRIGRGVRLIHSRSGLGRYLRRREYLRNRSGRGRHGRAIRYTAGRVCVIQQVAWDGHREERPGRFGPGPRCRLFPLTGGWGSFGRGSYAGMTYSYYDSVAEAAAWVRGHARAVPTVAVVLGSGLGAFADRVADPRSFPYSDIPNWPASGVIGHAGRLVLGRVQDTRGRRSRRPRAPLRGPRPSNRDIRGSCCSVCSA